VAATLQRHDGSFAAIRGAVDMVPSLALSPINQLHAIAKTATVASLSFSTSSTDRGAGARPGCDATRLHSVQT